MDDETNELTQHPELKMMCKLVHKAVNCQLGRQKKRKGAIILMFTYLKKKLVFHF